MPDLAGRRLRALLLTAVAAVVIALAPLPVRASSSPASPQATWVAAWGTAVARQDASTVPLTQPDGRTLRLFARSAADGSRVRIRLANTDGGGTVTFGRVTVGLHAANTGPVVSAGTIRQVRFAGKPGVAVRPGAVAVSDPVDLPVANGSDLAVSLFVVSAPGALTGHYTAKRIAWLTSPGSGDQSLDEPGAAFDWPTTSSYWLSGVDVLTRPRPVVVAIGDSITDGHLAAPDMDQDWPAQLGKRLAGSAVVINAGIGGNTVTRIGCAPCGPPIIDRFDRDVLDVPGVTHVVLFAGTNDIAAGVPAAKIEQALSWLAARAHARGLKVIGGTITPRKDTFLNWNPAIDEPVRAAVNSWVRHNREYDAFVDFDAVIRDVNDRTQMDYRYDSGDRLHPNALGFTTMADAVDTRLVTR